MSGEAKIFLIGQEPGTLIPMTQTSYTTESVLQALLAQYPDLLPGDQINPEAPRRWLLVSREMGIPGNVGETSRWSLDHLFLDQDGIPTFVECKRAVDTRARREVVAQMLDYAANGIEYWAIDRLRQAAAETAQNQGNSLDGLILALLDETDEVAVETYWRSVESNLRNGRVRLIFVADETTAELRRLVEFLNEKLLDVEVLAVEIRQFLGHEQKALVPRVVGLTEAGRRQKPDAGKSQTTRAEFLNQLPPEAVAVFTHILDRAEAQGHTIYWGQKGFSIRTMLQQKQRLVSFMYGWPNGQLEFYFGYLPHPPQELARLRQQLLDFGVFAPAGEKTLRAQVANAASTQILEMVKFVLGVMERMAATY